MSFWFLDVLSTDKTQFLSFLNVPMGLIEFATIMKRTLHLVGLWSLWFLFCQAKEKIEYGLDIVSLLSKFDFGYANKLLPEDILTLHRGRYTIVLPHAL